MMAKAIAKQCNATFINISLSSLQSKWYGESQRLSKAIFTLARKFAPAIVFLDEVDLFLRKRSRDDHEASAASKAEFMTQWDGLTSNNEQGGVCVLAATNRPWDIDDAVLRRFARQLCFDLPTETERAEIVRVLLRDVRLDDTIDYEDIAAATTGYSGSDLKEVCRVAAMTPIRELIAQHRAAMENRGGLMNIAVNDLSTSVARPIRQADLLVALESIEPTGQESVRYLKEFQAREAAKMRRS